MPNLTKPYNRITTEDLLSPNLEISPEMSRRAYLNILEDMQTEKTDMEQQRIATFNIMEDITGAQEELKKRYSELDALKNLVQELGSSLKTAAVLSKLVRALKNVLPASANLSYIIPSVDPGKPSNLMYVHAVTPLSAAYLDAVKENVKLSFDLLPIKVQRREEIKKWIGGKFLFEFVEGTKDGDKTALPCSIFNVPLVVRDEVLGIVNISSQRPGLFTKQEINLANTMAGATASTISRLRQLLDSEQSRIQSLVESLTNGVIMFDQDLRVTMSNPVAQQMTGLPSQGFYLSELTKLFTGAAAAAAADKELLATFDVKISQTLETGEVTHIEEIHISRFSYEVFVNPVRDYEKNIIGGAIILHDITHLKEIDRMKTEFVSVASHQLRTPLTTINWYAEMLQSEDAGKLNKEQRQFLDEIYAGSKRMARLVNDLLNVSRLETGRLKIEPQKTIIEKFLEDIIHELEPMTAGRECKIVFKKPKNTSLPINIDRTLIRQVIHNLITNAVRYSPAGMCDVTVELSQQDHSYQISVLDKGIGIPKDAQGKIFEKFFRADNAREKEAEGSGIGLYIAKMIVEASGGKIWFESPIVFRIINGKKKEYGTKFYLSIPISGMKPHEGEKRLA